MKHDDAWPLLDPLLDGALAAPERWAICAHLDECPVCRRQLADQARLRGLVRGRLLAVDVPADLRERIRDALAAERAPVAPVATFPLPLARRVAVVLGPALVALWLLVRLTASSVAPASSLPADLALSHALFAHDANLLDVKGDAATVAAWFHDTAGLTLAVPELDGYELIGGRLTVIEGTAAAQLVYEAEPNDRYLSVLQFRERPADATLSATDEEVSVGQQGTASLLTWTAGGERIVLVAAVPEAELRRLAKDLVPTADSPLAES